MNTPAVYQCLIDTSPTALPLVWQIASELLVNHGPNFAALIFPSADTAQADVRAFAPGVLPAQLLSLAGLQNPLAADQVIALFTCDVQMHPRGFPAFGTNGTRPSSHRALFMIRFVGLTTEVAMSRLDQRDGAFILGQPTPVDPLDPSQFFPPAPSVLH